MRTVFAFALVGDHNPSIPAHRAIPVALAMAATFHQISLSQTWIATSEIDSAERIFSTFDGIWCVPGSPYRNADGAMKGIQFAREQGIPFLGTCGGFQHALLEFAANCLGIQDATHAESDPLASRPLIAPLACSLVDDDVELVLEPGSILQKSYGTTRVVEQYRCSYGPNPEHERSLFSGELRATARDRDGNVRGAELTTHPFFVGVLFQPERRAFKGLLPPLVRDFVGAVQNR